MQGPQVQKNISGCAWMTSGSVSAKKNSYRGSFKLFLPSKNQFETFSTVERTGNKYNSHWIVPL
jgi:hypothetical protein